MYDPGAEEDRCNIGIFFPDFYICFVENRAISNLGSVSSSLCVHIYYIQNQI